MCSGWPRCARWPSTPRALQQTHAELAPLSRVGLCTGETPALSDDAQLLPDVLASLNSGELARQRLREVARVAGLSFSGYPDAPKSTRQLQASSSLFSEVFRKYDPGNRLLGQAEAEVLSQELPVARHWSTCAGCAQTSSNWLPPALSAWG